MEKWSPSNTQLKTLYQISIKKKPEKDKLEEEERGEKEYPPHYWETKEGEMHINESKAPKWMDVKIKIKEFNTAIEGWPKMARIGDYWSEQQTT